MAKSLQTRYSVGDNVNLIPFRGEKPRQTLPQSTIVLDDQNPLHWSRSRFGDWSVQGCCQRRGCHIPLSAGSPLDSHVMYHSAASSKIYPLCELLCESFNFHS